MYSVVQAIIAQNFFLSVKLRKKNHVLSRQGENRMHDNNEVGPVSAAHFCYPCACSC